MYHVTLKRNLRRIFNEGLQPRLGPRACACKESEPAVFLFLTRDDCDNALENWLGECFENTAENALAILEITLPESAKTKSDVPYEVACLTPIPVEHIARVHHEDWSIDTRNYQKPKSKSLGMSL